MSQIGSVHNNLSWHNLNIIDLEKKISTFGYYDDSINLCGSVHYHYSVSHSKMIKMEIEKKGLHCSHYYNGQKLFD